MYKKQDAVMTHGFAILCMVVLHLFCRTGEETYGTPLIWITDTKSLMYYFGFFAEICLPIYTITAGYAQMLTYQKKVTFRDRGKKILSLLINYWIILVIFSVLGLLIHSPDIPINTNIFLKNVFLVLNYTGIWWYLRSYLILTVLPISFSLFPVHKIKKFSAVLLLCLLWEFAWYYANRFDYFPPISQNPGFLGNARTLVEAEFYNISKIIPYYWTGALLCKHNVFEKLQKLLQPLGTRKNLVLAAGEAALFLVTVILNKAVLIGMAALLTFLWFNLTEKPRWIEKIFLFLGKHSTNTWLVHSFFYLVLFPGLVMEAQYPLLILLAMLALCILSSYIIQAIQKPINRLVFKK